MEWVSISGRKKSDWIDFYQTPQWVTKKLLDNISLSWTILEPASGSWAISKVLEAYGYNVQSQDIRTDERVYWVRWVSIFDCSDKYDTIITNPPYFCAKDFILKSLELSDNVIMLLKLQFLESADRYNFFKNTPLKKVYVICKRVTMYPDGEPEPKNSWTIAYAWYIWDKSYTGNTEIEWLL